jgi:hypothetical protein
VEQHVSTLARISPDQYLRGALSALHLLAEPQPNCATNGQYGEWVKWKFARNAAYAIRAKAHLSEGFQTTSPTL